MHDTAQLVKYKSRDGQDLTLTTDVIKKYLVSGRSQFVTDQELMYFMQICKAKGLNPFKKDCYLIKYSQNDSAAIVVSIDYFRSRARAMKDCRGWKKGIIVQGKDGKIHDSFGLILEGEKLLGGFFEATPEGWTEPFRLEVNLNGYIKKTSDGKITRFWKEENQPSQIAKVAESQGLRTLWPDEFQGLYTDLEPTETQGPPIDIYPEENGQGEQGEDLSFDDYMLKHYPETDAKLLDQFLKECAKLGDCSVEVTKKKALEKMDSFMSHFEKFKNKLKSQEKPKRTRKPKEEKPKEEPPKQEPQKEPDKEPDPVYTNLHYCLNNFEEVFRVKAKELGFPDEIIIDELPLDMANMLHNAINKEVDKY